MFPFRLWTAAALLLGALACPVLTSPTARADEPTAAVPVLSAQARKLDLVRGKLVVHKTGDGEKCVEVEVGKTKYVVIGADAARATRFARKFVSVRGSLLKARTAPKIELGRDGGLEQQQRSRVRGTVVAAAGAKDKFTLEGTNAAYGISRQDASKFKAFAGKHVEALAFVVSGPGFAALESVRSVERVLLPGEREPRSGEAAVAGSWSGKIVAERVPSGVPNVKAGDSFPLAFATDGKLAETTGRLMDAYDVVGLRLRKFRTKGRAAEVELAYTFGRGSHAIRLKGAFGGDWKTFKGTWSSGFLGSGTFELVYRQD